MCISDRYTIKDSRLYVCDLLGDQCTLDVSGGSAVPSFPPVIARAFSDISDTANTLSELVEGPCLHAEGRRPPCPSCLSEIAELACLDLTARLSLDTCGISDPSRHDFKTAPREKTAFSWRLHQQFESYKEQVRKIGEEARRYQGEHKDDAPTCGICHKTKFADGCGHLCSYCRTKFCARCGGRVSLRSNNEDKVVRIHAFYHFLL
ncbi:uncharacterized protein LOC112957604 [Nothoprocta perdicaria]|uniref:uncharacterized protein LOC112957604 n=1 Tax=Nothoprocta perdicaria TaxID=30464 RepID=UPI000E1B9FE1|nr:uncharacterized protein LOC112957604 [Nothoprocta perdicaria]